MKRLFALTLALLLLLTGCGAKEESAMGYAPAAPAATESAMEEVLLDKTSSETGSSTSLPENQKLIRTVNMDAETRSMTDLVAWMDGRVAALGGYYEQKSVYRRGSRDDGSYYHSGNFMIRIPAENLDQFVASVGDNANVTSTSESTENVTLQYVSTQSRVEALEVEQDRLLELLENAEKLGVSRNIRGITVPVDEYSIEPLGYDLILAASVLEHLDSRESMERKLAEIAAGIRPGGAVLIVMNTGVRECDTETGELLEPQFEVNLPPREARALLEKTFSGWQILWDKCIHYEYEVPRGSRLAMICAEVVTFTARRQE